MPSLPHLILVFLVALIVLGPAELPKVARTLSKAMLEFRRATSGLRETLDQEMRQLEREIEERGQAPGSQASAHGKPGLTPMSDSPDELPGEAAPYSAPAEEGDSGFEPSSTADSQEAPAPEADSGVSPNADPSGKPPDGHPTSA